jgi:hypothetical protein
VLPILKDITPYTIPATAIMFQFEEPPESGNELHDKLVQRLWPLLLDYISNSETPTTFAQELLQISCNFSTVDQLGFYFLRVAYVTFCLVGQLEHDNFLQDRVVDVIFEFENILNPPPERRWNPAFSIFKVYEMFLFKAPLEPPFAEIIVSDPYRYGSPKLDADFNIALSVDNWTNLNAFLAKFLTRLIPAEQNIDTGYPIFFEWLAIWAVIESLEYALDRTTLENNLPASACWLIYASTFYRRLYWEPLCIDRTSVRRTEGTVGPYYQGKVPFCEDRWNLWKKRLSDLELLDLSLSVKKFVTLARQQMEEVEVSLPQGVAPKRTIRHSFNKPLDS